MFLIADKLSLIDYGNYGFALLFIQYMSYSNLGINYSSSIIASDKSYRNIFSENLIAYNALFITLITSVILLLIFFFTQEISFFGQYSFSQYYLLLIIISILQNFNLLYVNLFRFYNRYNEINLYYLLPGLIQLPLILFSNPNTLINTLFYSLIFSYIISFLLFSFSFYRSTESAELKLDLTSVRILVFRGFSLLIYNITYYGFFLSFRTFVSINFSSDDFAIFNFAYNISNALMLFLGTLSFLYYPTLINKISIAKNNHMLSTFVINIRDFYCITFILLVFVLLLFSPLIASFLPKFNGSLIILETLLMGQIVLAHTYGFTTLMIQKNYDRKLIIYAVISIISIIALSIIFESYFKLSLSYLSIALVLGLVLYNILLYKFIIQSYSSALKEKFVNHRIILPLILYVFLRITFNDTFYVYVLTLCIFVLGNYRSIIQIFHLIKKIVKNDKGFLEII